MGQSITLTHLAPFVDISRKKIRAEVESEIAIYNELKNRGIFNKVKKFFKKILHKIGLGKDPDAKIDRDTIEKIVDRRLRNEVKKGIQTIQYQVVTLMTTNGFYLRKEFGRYKIA